MKYVVILVVVVILVRIDVILRLFDKTAKNFQQTSTVIKPDEIEASSVIVPIAKDLSLKVSPRKNFISMVNDFTSAPDEGVKTKAIEVLLSDPKMFTDQLDNELESSIYRWRDLLIQRDKVTHEFLIQLINILKGENLEMVKRFFSFAIDIDLGDFLKTYSNSTDTNCMIITYLGDNLPIEEKYNELSARLKTLNIFLLTDRAPDIKLYAERCQLVLKLQVDKLKVTVAPEEEAPVPLPAPTVSSEPAPVVPVTPIDPSTNPGTTP